MTNNPTDPLKDLNEIYMKWKDVEKKKQSKLEDRYNAWKDNMSSEPHEPYTKSKESLTKETNSCGESCSCGETDQTLPENYVSVEAFCEAYKRALESALTDCFSKGEGHIVDLMANTASFTEWASHLFNEFF